MWANITKPMPDVTEDTIEEYVRKFPTKDGEKPKRLTREQALLIEVIRSYNASDK